MRNQFYNIEPDRIKYYKTTIYTKLGVILANSFLQFFAKLKKGKKFYKIEPLLQNMLDCQNVQRYRSKKLLKWKINYYVALL